MKNFRSEIADEVNITALRGDAFDTFCPIVPASFDITGNQFTFVITRDEPSDPAVLTLTSNAGIAVTNLPDGRKQIKVTATSSQMATLARAAYRYRLFMVKGSVTKTLFFGNFIVR